MVEGPTAHKFSYDINTVFRDKLVIDSYYKTKKAVIEPRELVGRRILGSEAYGKNILIHIDEYTVRLHLMLYGTIHIQALNEDLRKPFNKVRLQIKTDSHKLTVYNAPVVEIDFRDNIIEHIKKSYGPDPLREDWDRKLAYKNLVSYGGASISKALLDQSVISGIGNILRNEILYRAGIHPEKPVRELSEDELDRVIYYVERLSNNWYNLKLRGGRLKPMLKVYNNYRGKCGNCGQRIIFYIQGDIGRKTFYCPKCQKR